MKPEYANIPDELRARPQWVVWRHEERDGKKTKVPYRVPDSRIAQARHASTTDPSTWTTFDRAVGAAEYGFDGIGYVFSADDPYTGVDWDCCLDGGEVLEWAADKIAAFCPSYAEISPSGRGVKAIVRAKLPGPGTRRNGFGGDKAGAVEMYDRGRYFTITGDRWSDSECEVVDRQAAVDRLYREIHATGQERKESASAEMPAGEWRPPTASLSDAEIVAKLIARGIDSLDPDVQTFRTLYQVGDTTRFHGDHSAADFALCKILAKWVGDDPARVERIFSESALADRDKWRDRADSYRRPTILRAIDSARDDAGRTGSTGSTGSTGRGGASHASRASRAGSDYVDEPVVPREWPAPPDDAAFRGIAGQYARAVGNCSEADPVGVLVQLLAGFGVLIGRWIYWQVDSTRHYLNIFLVTVGTSGIGRKGMAWDIARSVLAPLDPKWAARGIQGGLSSGEGLIGAVHDPIVKSEPIREKGRITGYQDVIVDQGVEDKRLLVTETELSKTFKVMNRENNTLSALVRQAFDTGNLRVMTKQPMTATDAHIGIIGHITDIEAARHLNQTEAANGFGNRFLWFCVRMGELRPRGGSLPDIQQTGFQAAFADRFKAAQRLYADGPYRIELDPSADALWDEFYRRVHRPRFGFLGHLFSRAAPITMRIAAIYALLDGDKFIQKSHLESAIALWDYAERSATYTFGESLGDPDTERLLDALDAAEAGLTQEQIHEEVFSSHRPRKVLARLLARLLEAGLIRSEVQPTKGRPRTVWFPVRP